MAFIFQHVLKVFKKQYNQVCAAPRSKSLVHTCTVYILLSSAFGLEYKVDSLCCINIDLLSKILF